MALTESLCTQNTQVSDRAPWAQASGTAQTTAYPTSRTACLTPPRHRSITVWTIWPSPITTGTPIGTPATGTSGTETGLWVRLRTSSILVGWYASSAKLQAWNLWWVICLLDLMFPLWENFIGINISFNSCVFSYGLCDSRLFLFFFFFSKGCVSADPRQVSYINRHKLSV